MCIRDRFPLGISFPGGSGIVAFAAAIGSMPLNVPESILVKFKGDLLQGITFGWILWSDKYFTWLII